MYGHLVDIDINSILFSESVGLLLADIYIVYKFLFL